MIGNAISMDSSHQPKKSTLACEKCRVLKVKCIRPEEGKPCSKCTRSNSQCVVPEPKRRAKVPQGSKPRLADLESKLTNIIGLLSHSSAPHSGVQNSVETDPEWPPIPEYLNDSPYLPAEWMSLEFPAASEVGENPELNENKNSAENTPEKSPDVSTALDSAWIADLGVNPIVLQHLLDRFCSMRAYFPFVSFSYTWTAASMREDRPFLLLAAVAAASSKHCHLQDDLIRRFKDTISQRVIMAGEKDLDLLQGLLVYLAWCHFDFVPGNRQDYLYLQIAISMVVDLNIDQEIADLLDHRTELSDTYILEACRAYLGCYYMSNIIAMCSGRPNNLKFHNNMLRCAMLLQKRPEFETDLMIYPLTKLLQFAEEVCETYRAERILGGRLHIHAERFAARLEDWWSSLTEDLRNTVLLNSGYHTVKIRIQDMGLVYRYGQRRSPPPQPQEDSTLSLMPPMIAGNLIKCVNSTKESIDSFLDISVAEYNSLSFPLWYQVILTLFVLYRLSVALPEVPEWNVEIAQQTVDLQAYLDTLFSRLRIIEPCLGRQIPTKSLFSRLYEVIGSVKASYALAKENPAEICDSRHAHHELKDPNNTVSLVQRLHRCPALRYSSRHVAPAPGQHTLQNAISAELQKIEDEKVLDDLLMLGGSSLTSAYNEFL
ncbi:conserved hypothetical protein [Talaromyces stipitatus ATCC 10500]|uniref:Zn(2)-C6 fungal-type domain-containing protein n=1 Tax=Talaromyces stipitatus (strain ATCC 10500 / CBS 375.48 / QM 6759 / NRRL 1006) TaxID=441959 RepID=B8MG13_TALSN|nr:uncharacterized protein TSTA_009980 [Talaromyces stipitatus ATCC 10500]EED15880.1 conserved hypothetical protein [Talaromyces stipitatus ATCC 10500]